MPSPQHVTTPAAYRPTSLDFINLPNPIEPSAGSQRHPLNGTPRLDNARLEKNPGQGLFHLIHDSGHSSTGSGPVPGERPEKRQKLTDNTLLDLPRLPVRHATKRMRIPPTLSGLHQPPPNAGLLPSINIEKPRGSQSPRPSNLGAGPDLTPAETQTDVATRDERAKATGKRTRRTRWTSEETRCLLQGVARFGIGNWTKILNCSDFEFNHRTALDLKDRFRVCRPADYRTSAVPHRTAATSNLETDAIKGPRGNAQGRVSVSQLKKFGINQPFTKTSRRQRHGYSPAEDEALLQGFHLYGNAWAAIRSDRSLGLSTRTATDLRDRFRTRYPEEYADAGLALRQEKSTAKRSDPLPVDVGSEPDSSVPMSKSNPAKKRNDPPPIDLGNEPDSSASVLKANNPKKPSAPALFSLDDIFWGADCGIDQSIEDGEPIVLDRGILDWAANDGPRSLPADNAKNGGIDPLMTLNLPKLASSSQAHGSATNLLPKTNGVTSLPSLASMVSNGNPSTEYNEPPGLPSIVQWLNPAENESGTGFVTSGYPNQDDHPGC